MDTKDKDSELASPGVMFPDSSMSPLVFEEGLAVDGAPTAPGTAITEVTDASARLAAAR